MNATARNKIGAGGPVVAPASLDLAIAPPRDIVPDRRAANADDFRPRYRRMIEAAAAGVAGAVVGVAQGLRDDLERRRTVRELRLLGRFRLVDIGIEPNDVERVVDDMIAARRSRTSAGGRRPRPRSE